MKYKIHILLLLFTAFLAVSCQEDPDFVFPDGGRQEAAPAGTVTPQDASPTVTIIYSIGYNSLSGALKTDLQDLEKGYLPLAGMQTDNILLVFSRNARGSSQPKPESCLYRLYSDADGNPVREDLKTWDGSVNASDPQTFAEVMNYAKENFKAKGYGVVFSSHASGWLPPRYYYDPGIYGDSVGGDDFWGVQRRSIGEDQNPEGSVEMDIKEFAKAIPFKLDYLLFDACLCGCVELAYELKDKVDVVGFSPTEILSDGFDYVNITRHLVSWNPDPVAVCKDYFDMYDARSGRNRAATISVIETGKMGSLAAVCRELFEEYREQIKTLNASSVQNYFRVDYGNRHYFYDLLSILQQAGITRAEEDRLLDALNECTLYAAATPQFLSITIKTYCGLSMYLVSNGTAFLNGYYMDYAWNTDTGYIKNQ